MTSMPANIVKSAPLSSIFFDDYSLPLTLPTSSDDDDTDFFYPSFNELKSNKSKLCSSCPISLTNSSLETDMVSKSPFIKELPGFSDFSFSFSEEEPFLFNDIDAPLSAIPSSSSVSPLSVSSGSSESSGSYESKHTLILDLDETLVHCSKVPGENADFSFTVEYLSKKIEMFTWIRPGVEKFLCELSKSFSEIVVFTASQKIYADTIISHLDPENKYFGRRFYRDSCILKNGAFVKDLTKVSNNLDEIVIVDNSPVSYSLQPENGIPIKSFYTDKSDACLLTLIPLLKELTSFYNIRSGIFSLITTNLSLKNDLISDLSF